MKSIAIGAMKRPERHGFLNCQTKYDSFFIDKYC